MAEPNSTPASAFASTWTAVRNDTLGQPHRLTVTGELELPTPGWTLHLSKAVPQGINPEILLLHLHRTPPSGIEPQHVVTDHVSYEEHTNLGYQQVQIEPDNVTVEVVTIV